MSADLQREVGLLKLIQQAMAEQIGAESVDDFDARAEELAIMEIHYDACLGELARAKGEIERLRSLNAGQAQRLNLIAWWCGAPDYKVVESAASLPADFRNSLGNDLWADSPTGDEDK